MPLSRGGVRGLQRTLAVLQLILLCACAAPLLPAQSPGAAEPFEQDLVRATDELLQDWRARRVLPLFLTRLSPRTLALGAFVDTAADAARPAAFAPPPSQAALLARGIVERRIDAAAPEFRRVALSASPHPGLLLSARLEPAAPLGHVLTLTLFDTRTRSVESRWQGLVRASPGQGRPARFVDASPALQNEERASALYGATPDEILALAEAESLLARALIEQAQAAYAAARYEQALGLFQQAVAQPGTQAIRAYNGQYLCLLRLGREAEARQAFRQLVAQGFATHALAMKLLFTPGTTEFLKDPVVSGAYDFWLQEIAARAVAASACLKVVGHTSRTGLEAFNRELSLLRSRRVLHVLEARAASLHTRLQALGVGWTENIVGSGTDDARDAVDRRVEFRIVDCAGG